MMTLDDVAAIVAGFEEAVEVERHGRRAWSVTGKVFAWERPFSKADLKRFGGATPPTDPIVAVRLDDLEETRAVLAEQRPGIFSIQHFEGYPAVLIELSAVPEPVLRETLLDGWLACAPPRLTDAYLDRDA